MDSKYPGPPSSAKPLPPLAASDLRHLSSFRLRVKLRSKGPWADERGNEPYTVSFTDQELYVNYQNVINNMVSELWVSELW